MKTETLIKQLEAKGYVYPYCLQWKLDDLDLRMRSIGMGDNLPLMDNTDKRMILDSFFEEIQDDIIEYINIRIEDYLQEMTRFDLSQETF